MRTKIKQKTLKNGIRVITSSSNQTSFASYCISFAAGTRFADNKHSGIAHFVEHCLFHSTNKHSKKELALIERDYAATSNASTSDPAIDFETSCFAKDVYKMMDITFERIFDSKYDHEEIDNERGIVHQEISRSTNDKRNQILNKIYKTLYPTLFVGNFQILGAHEELDGITYDEIKDYVNKNFLPSRMIVSASGNVNIRGLSKYLRKKFPTNVQNKPLVIEQKGEKGRWKDEYIEECFLGNNSVKIFLHLTNDLKRGTKEHVALSMLTMALTGIGTDSSIMYSRIREEKQLVYSIYTTTDSYEKSEYFLIAFETTRLKEVFKEICDCLKDVAKNGVNERVLEQCRQQKRKEIGKRDEDICGRPPHIAAAKLLAGEDASEEYYKKTNAFALSITNEDIKKAAQSVLDSGRVVIVTDSKLFGAKEAKEFKRLFMKAKKEI